MAVLLRFFFLTKSKLSKKKKKKIGIFSQIIKFLIKQVFHISIIFFIMVPYIMVFWVAFFGQKHILHIKHIGIIFTFANKHALSHMLPSQLIIHFLSFDKDTGTRNHSSSLQKKIIIEMQWYMATEIQSLSQKQEGNCFILLLILSSGNWGTPG